MAITKINPRTILLTKRETAVIDNEHEAGGAITPGMLIELYDGGSEAMYRAHATDTELTPRCVALDQPWLNEGIGDAYATGDLVTAAYLQHGAVFYGIIPSGQNIQYGELLMSNGDGKLKTASATTADAALGQFQSLDEPGSVTADTRIRVQVVG